MRMRILNRPTTPLQLSSRLAPRPFAELARPLLALIAQLPDLKRGETWPVVFRPHEARDGVERSFNFRRTSYAVTATEEVMRKVCPCIPIFVSSRKLVTGALPPSLCYTFAVRFPNSCVELQLDVDEEAELTLALKMSMQKDGG